MTDPADPGPGPDPAGGASAGVCSNCGAPRAEGETFCVVCGLDHATGGLPATPPAPGPAAAPTGWQVVLEADRAFFESNQAESPDVTVEFPAATTARTIELAGDEVHIGRRSDSAGVYPGIDLTDDPGVSRRHAVLRHRPDDSWVVVDLGSTNGTRVRGGDEPIPADEEQPVAEGDIVHVGAWSRLTLQRTASS